MRAGQLAKAEEQAADVWVFTECMKGFVVGATSVESRLYPGSLWRWVSIQGADITPIDESFAADLGAAAIASVGGERVVVVGSVLPWRAAHKTLKLPGLAAETYEAAFDFVLQEHVAVIRRLRADYPDLPLIWAGDFNQELGGGTAGAGTNGGRIAVRRLLADLDMSAYTADECSHAGGPAIDHICGPTGRAEAIVQFPSAGLSDHAGYVVTLSSR